MNCTIPKKQILNKPFCKNFNMKKSYIDTTVNTYNNFEKLIDEKNERFIQKEMVKEKDYLDNVLKSVDPVIDHDEDQRRVVLSDEDYTLVIAGAGAGKTTTVAAKVKYLVDRRILILRRYWLFHLLTRPLPLSP